MVCLFNLLTKDFKSVDPVKSAMAQFHQKGSWPTLMFQLNDDGYFADRQWQNQTDEYRKLLEINDMKGKWNDILININSNVKRKTKVFIKYGLIMN